LRERRNGFRVEWNSPAMMHDAKGRFMRSCVVSNFSNGGAKIVGIESEAIPNEFMLRISPHGRAHRCQVVWRSKDGLGVEFVGRDVDAPAPGRGKKALHKSMS
jgi:hypothetical protein